MSDEIDFDVGSEARRALPGKLLKNFVQFAATAVIARFLGADGLGTYTILFTLVKTSTVFTNGVGEALKKRMSEADSDPAQHVGAGLIFHLLFVVLTAVPALAVIHGRPSLLPVSVRAAYVLLFAYHAFGLLNLSRHMYAAVGEPANAIWIEPLSRSLILAAQVALLWTGHEISGLLVGILLGSAATAAVSLYLTGTPPALPSLGVVRRIADFAKWSIPGELLGAAYGYSDIVALYLLLGPTALGYFSAAAKIVLVGTVVGPSLAQPLTVKTSNNHSKDEAVDNPLATSLTFAGFISLPLLALSLAVPEIMPLVFGESFADTGYALVLIAAYSVVSVYKSQFAAAFNGVDLPRLPTITRSIQLVVYVPLMVWLTATYGLVGALIGSLVVELLGFAVFLSFATNRFDRLVNPRAVGAQVLASGVVYVVAGAVFGVLGGVIGLIAAVVVSTIGYVLVTYVTSSRLNEAYTAYSRNFRR